MPVEFLSDEQVAAYGRFTGELPAGELERFFYLDDADRDLVARRRSDHHRLGFASVRAVSRRARVDARGGPATLFEQLAFVSWIERNASNNAYVKLRDAVTCAHP